jgi:hypothetical protein
MPSIPDIVPRGSHLGNSVRSSSQCKGTAERFLATAVPASVSIRAETEFECLMIEN